MDPETTDNLTRAVAAWSIFIKNQIYICRCGEPNATSKFIVKLMGRTTRSSSGVSFEGFLKTSSAGPFPNALLLARHKGSRKVSKGELKPELHFRINEPPNLMGMGFP